ncbi:hypothetical protein JHK85_018504 [Glycine max]|nr:hypothetical protein JHK85_018504 [Glycine max]
MEPSFLIEADATEDKGARHTMEDASVMLLDVSLDYPGNLRCAHFAIYDGHGGRLAAEYARKHLHQNVLSAGLPHKHHRQYNYGYFVEQSFDEFSSWFVSVFFKVVVANIGDAKAVLARSTNGSQNHPDGVQTQLKAIVLTREHKPIFQLERARIEKV